MAMQGTDIALHCGFVLPTMISGSCPSAPGQQDILPSGHRRPEDIAHTGYPLF